MAVSRNLDCTMEDKDVVIIDAVRTPWGSFLGTLSPLTATQLGAVVVKGLLERNKPGKEEIKNLVDLVIMGNVLSAGLGQNPARQAALNGGLPPSVEAVTVNMVCGSSLKAAMDAANAIKAGYAEVVIAGGIESMSNAPYLLPKGRTGYRLDHGKVLDSMITDGLWDAYNDYHMGITGELVSEKYGIKREEQDLFAYNSHQKAIKAIEAGKFKKEIVPVVIPRKKQDPLAFDTDESPRKDTTIEKLARLPAIFKKGGTLTAGNSSSISDGASAVLMTSYGAAKKHGLKPLAKVTGYASGGVEPQWVMLAPIKAVQNLLAKTGYKADNFDLVELNEAFAVQAIAGIRELGFDPKRVNVNGSGISLGHPLGATGTRLLASLIHALHDRDDRVGLAALCLGGGNAVAMSVERC